MFKKIKNKKNIFVIIIALLLIIGGTITYFFNQILFSHEISNKVENVTCTQEAPLFGDINLSCTNTSESEEKVLLRFKYDSFWKYEEQDCPVYNGGGGGEYVVNPDWNQSNPGYSYPSDPDDIESGPPTDPLELIAYNLELPVNYMYVYNYTGSQKITITWDDDFSTNFVYNGNDGWFYYKKALKPGETVNIIKSITKNYEIAENDEYIFNFSHEESFVNNDLVNEIWNVTFTKDNLDNVNWSF